MRVIFGVGYHTATDVHHHRAQALREHRADVLLDAYLDHPERFVRKIPAPPELPTAAWINPPPPPDTKEENQFRSNGTEGPPRQRTATSDNVAGHNESQVVLSQNG